jgi:hypothetical protein
MSAEDDVQHLKLLSIFHYIVAGLTAAFSSMFLIHAGLGLTMLMRPGSFDGKNRPDPFAGWLFFAMGCAAVAFGWTLAAGIGLGGRFLAKRKHHTFCLVMAGIEAGMCSPFGTVLGVFTIIVLLRPSVKELFNPSATLDVPT